MVVILSGRVQRVVIDVASNEDVKVVYGVRQGIVLYRLWFLMHTSNLSMILGNTLLGCADD